MEHSEADKGENDCFRCTGYIRTQGRKRLGINTSLTSGIVQHPLLQQVSSLDLSVRQEDRETKENPMVRRIRQIPLSPLIEMNPLKVRNM
ncbi:hypothetical protein LTR74_008747 [Friedmanniomyces endolithicus]|nr:hypothetical protein LTR74_008747 [Friedmanniomyces endolithicus]